MLPVVVGAAVGVFASDFLQSKFADKLGSLPGGGKAVTVAAVVGGVWLAKRFL